MILNFDDCENLLTAAFELRKFAATSLARHHELIYAASQAKEHEERSRLRTVGDLRRMAAHEATDAANSLEQLVQVLAGGF